MELMRAGRATAVELASDQVIEALAPEQIAVEYGGCLEEMRIG